MIASSERRRILERLAAGCITAEHANELLERESAGAAPAPSARPPRGTAWLLSLDPGAGRPRHGGSRARDGGTHEERGGR